MPALLPAFGDAYREHTEHLRDELHRAAGYLRAQIARFRHTWPEAQRERFWHVPDDVLDAAAADDDGSPLNAFEPTATDREVLDWIAVRRAAIDARKKATRIDLRLPRLATEFHLAPIEIDALLVAMLPSLHSSYRRWFGILQHDAAKLTPTVGLLAEMLAGSSDQYAALLRVLAPDGSLGGSRLLIHTGVDDDPGPLRAVTVDDRVVAFLLANEDQGDRHDALDPRLQGSARWVDETVDLRTLPLPAETITRLEMLPNLRAADPRVFQRLRLQFFGPDAWLAARGVQAMAAAVQQRVLVVDAAAIGAGAAWPVVIECALRDARLGRAWPLFIGLSSLVERGEAGPRLEQLLLRLSSFAHPAALHFESMSADDARVLPGWMPFRLAAPTLGLRERLWASLLDTESHHVADRPAAARDLALAFQLTDTQIREAWRIAEGLARRRNVFMAAIERDDLFAACRQQSSKRLVAFAQRIEPRRTLTLERDLILPHASKQVLFELSARIRNHSHLHATLGLGDHMRLGRGVTACFSGGSGTGKTMAAEILASEHQIDLYRIDLASLVSKWVGETEQHLSRVLADAERANCMLFFDEADAMFGQRGEVKEARDRWANLEVNYLLQRIEDYSGVVILATNLVQNIDEAFRRRIHVWVPFPAPGATSRHLIWSRLLPQRSREAIADTDLRDLAEHFELTGGNIRNVVLDACFRTMAGGDAVVTLRQLVAGTAREYQKHSRPVTPGEFGRFYEWAMSDVIAPADVADEAMSEA